jgi:predicted HNH restriction endonuclease
VYTVFLHAAHVNHDPDNPTPELICLCPTCHGRYDYRARMKRQQLNHERLKHQLLLLSR